MKKRLPLYDRQIEDLVPRATGLESLVQGLRDLELKERQVLQFAVVGSQESLRSILASKPAAGIHRLESSGSMSVFRFVRETAKRTLSGEFATIPVPNTPITVLTWVSPRRFWRNALLPFLEGLYPEAALPFLTQKELYGALRFLQSRRERGVRILELSSKKRLAMGARKKFESIREWTDETLDSAFSAARENNVWFRSVKFQFTGPEGLFAPEHAQGIVSKYGYVACDGDFEIFADLVFNRLAPMASERLEFFSKRDRISTADNEPRPLTIAYDREIFTSPEQNAKLLEALGKFRNGTCTVFHGNPYLHVALVDNRDLSSVEIWVLSASEIILVPQIRASENAIKRVVNHIFEHFREGSLSEHNKAA